MEKLRLYHRTKKLVNKLRSEVTCLKCDERNVKNPDEEIRFRDFPLATSVLTLFSFFQNAEIITITCKNLKQSRSLTTSFGI